MYLHNVTHYTYPQLVDLYSVDRSINSIFYTHTEMLIQQPIASTVI